MMSRDKIKTIADYPLPDSQAVERLLLYELITLPAMLPDSADIVTTEMFSDKELGKVWELLFEKQTANKTIDFTTISQDLPRELLQAIIASFKASTAEITASTILDHAQALRTLYTRRKCYALAVEAIDITSSNNCSLDTLLARIEETAETIKRHTCSKAAANDICNIFNDLYDEIEQTHEAAQTGKRLRCPTSLPTLDAATYGGFNAGNLVILAARTSVGKTAIMLQMAKASTAAGKHAAIFSLETGERELAQRLVVAGGKITPKQIAAGEVDAAAFDDSISKYRRGMLGVNDYSRKVDDIVAKIISLKREKRCDIAFIDYLGLMAQAMEASNRPLYQIIAAITARLKQIAKDCQIPIVTLCQINRAQVMDGEPPQLHNLRDSGSIEQDADIVLMLDKGEADATLKMWVRKNRQGKKDFYIELMPNNTYTEFTEI